MEMAGELEGVTEEEIKQNRSTAIIAWEDQRSRPRIVLRFGSGKVDDGGRFTDDENDDGTYDVRNRVNSCKREVNAAG